MEKGRPHWALGWGPVWARPGEGSLRPQVGAIPRDGNPSFVAASDVSLGPSEGFCSSRQK